jgi:rhodanese-related sulfurtransferase
MLDRMEHAHPAARTLAPSSPSSSPTAPGARSPETGAPGGPGAGVQLGYAGDVAPGLAWQLVQSGQATLVDVRTAEELHYVGRVPGALHVEWARGREQVRNERFLEQLAEAVPPDRQVLFLCRSGVRSVSAAKAATGAGYRSAWNILQGFEGPLDTQKQRGRIGGWRAAGLPWQQS